MWLRSSLIYICEVAMRPSHPLIFSFDPLQWVNYWKPTRWAYWGLKSKREENLTKNIWFVYAYVKNSNVSESFLSSHSHKPIESESSKKFFESSQNHDLSESESSHKNCRVTSSHWFARSSQCWVTRNFTFFLQHFLLWNGAQHAIKWCPTS